MSEKQFPPKPCATHTSRAEAPSTRPPGLMGAGGGGNAAVMERLNARQARAGAHTPLTELQRATVLAVARGDNLAMTETEALNFDQSESEHAAASWRGRARTMTASDGTAVNADHVRIERLAGAESLAYKAPSEYTEEDRKTLADGCYAPDAADFISDDSGFQATLFEPDLSRPECEGVAPVFAARGTEGAPFSGGESNIDWRGNFSVGGVGRDPFAKNHGRVRGMLEKGRKDTGMKPIASGHSQGGALAQSAAVHNPGMVSEVLTYSSPGVSYGDARSHRDDVPVTHYAGGDDLVPTVGQRALAGRVREVNRPHDGSPITDHRLPLLQNLDEASVTDRPRHWSDTGILQEGLRAAGSHVWSAFEDSEGPQYGVERPAEMDERMRLAHQREWDTDTAVPNGVHGAADLDMAQTIMAGKEGRGEVEILHD